MRELYKILKISENASKNEVKDAYRRLALEFHPDVCKLPDAGEIFIEINMAYQAIMQNLEHKEKLHLKNHVEKETAQDIINSWMAAERERIRKRAQQHANMRYAQFRKSKLYRSSFVFPKFLALFSLVFGMSIIFGSVYGTLNQYHVDARVINFNYIASAFIIFSIGIAITAFSISRLIPFLRRN